MSPKELTAFRMAPDVMEAMRAVKTAEGIPIAVQIDFAIRAWLKAKGVTLGKTERKRAGTRKRS